MAEREAGVPLLHGPAHTWRLDGERTLEFVVADRNGSAWELAWAEPDRGLTPGAELVVLVRHDGVSAGFVQLDATIEEIVPSGVLDVVPAPVRPALAVPDQPVAVVIPTADRRDAAARCVRAVLAADGVARVVLVDNRPRAGRAHPDLERLTELDPRVRVIAEPTPGVSAARNAGVEACDEPVLAFTDDDTVVHRQWATGLAAALGAGADVAAGMVLPGQVHGEAERHFERRAQSGKGTLPVWTGPEQSLLDPLWALRPGAVGSGNSMAVRRETFDAVQGFHESIGAGTRVGGGEDLELIIRIVADGGRALYTPDAVIWHFHRATMADLSHQIGGWGSGLAAAGIAVAHDNRTLARQLLRTLPGTVRRFAEISRGPADTAAQTYPWRLVLQERLGVVRALRVPGPRRVRPMVGP